MSVLLFEFINFHLISVYFSGGGIQHSLRVEPQGRVSRLLSQVCRGHAEILYCTAAGEGEGVEGGGRREVREGGRRGGRDREGGERGERNKGRGRGEEKGDGYIYMLAWSLQE